MKYLTEFRNPKIVKKLSNDIFKISTKPHTIMEVCGGQTNSIVKNGIDQIIPSNVSLIHGPGCPVCVTPLEIIDKAIALASLKNIIFCSFGDMLRVPGSKEDLFSVKAKGGDVRIVYSPLDSLKIAKENPEKEIIFFAVGFETTAPGNAWTVYEAKKKNILNFSILVSHVLVPPAIEAILSAQENKIEGFLAAGHVCTVMGYGQYEPLAKKYNVPIIITGFEAIDILEGLYMCIKQLQNSEAKVENQYKRSVAQKGNLTAQKLLEDVFKIIPRKWRGIGNISDSGLALNPEYSNFDAEVKFKLSDISVEEPEECLSGLVLQGRLKPQECSAFAKKCTPEHPMGATMVSSEGACAAYYQYRR